MPRIARLICIEPVWTDDDGGKLNPLQSIRLTGPGGSVVVDQAALEDIHQAMGYMTMRRYWELRRGIQSDLSHGYPCGASHSPS